MQMVFNAVNTGDDVKRCKRVTNVHDSMVWIRLMICMRHGSGAVVP